MANVIGWVIAIGLIVLVNFVSVPIHRVFESRVRPPAAATPRSAPYPIQVYYDGKVTDSRLESGSEDGKVWIYTWMIASKSKAEAVARFYREKYPQA